ncbi:MAG: hypothetical protein ACT4PP_10060 [Sporichthyaceae bacterium]
MRVNPTLRRTTVAALAAGLSLTGAIAFSAGASPIGEAGAPTAAGESQLAAAKLRGVRLSGAFDERGPVTRAELLDFTQRTVKAKFEAGGAELSKTFTGPLLLDVLTAAGAQIDPEARNDSLHYAILARAADGYTAVLAFAELEAKYGAKRVLIGLSEDGRTLARPRLIVPGDAHGGRYVFDLATITLLRLSQSLAAGPAGNPDRSATGVTVG